MAIPGPSLAAANSGTSTSLIGVARPWIRALRMITPLRRSHSSRRWCFPVGQNRGAHVLGSRLENVDHLLDRVVAEPGALGARYGQAFGDVAARQRDDVVAAEHSGPPPGQRHQAGQRVEHEFAPIHGSEVGVAVHSAAGAAEQFGERLRRGPGGHHQRGFTAQSHPAFRLGLGRKPHAPGDDGRGRTVRLDLLDLLDTVLQDGYYGVVVAQAGQPAACVVVLGGFDRQYQHFDRAPGSNDVLIGIGVHRAGHHDGVGAVGPQFDVIAGGMAAKQYRVPGRVQQRRDRRADGAGANKCDVCGDETKSTGFVGQPTRPSRLSSRSNLVHHLIG